MSKRRICAAHNLVLEQCRCPCADVEVSVQCNDHCPKYGQPAEDAMSIHKIDASRARWEALARRQEKELEELRSLFQRFWRCEVFSSGYHNGSKCDPEDPHGGWNCGYVWGTPALSDERAQKLGLTE